MRSTQQHQTDFNKSTNLFMCSLTVHSQKALTLCKHIHENPLQKHQHLTLDRFKRRTITTNHPLLLFGSYPPPLPHTAISSQSDIYVWWQQQQKNQSISSFPLSLSTRCHAVAYFWCGKKALTSLILLKFHLIFKLHFKIVIIWFKKRVKMSILLHRHCTARLL